MNAREKGGKTLNRLTISTERAETKPDHTKTAAELLERCRAFYEDPENEEAFRKWKAGKEKEA